MLSVPLPLNTVSKVNYVPRVKEALPEEWEKNAHYHRQIFSTQFLNWIFFVFTGCKIQAGSSACGRCTHRRRGGRADRPPCRLQSGRNCSCTWWWGVGLHRWKTDTKKETENDGEAHFQLSRSSQPNWQKMQLKTKLRDCWCQHVHPNEDLRCWWTLSQHWNVLVSS